MRISVFLLFYSVVVVAQTKQQSSVLFTVGNQQVISDEFMYLFRKNHQSKPEDFIPGKIEEYLNLYIHFKLKVQEAQSRGMDTTETFKKEFDGYRKDIRKGFTATPDDLERLTKEAYQRLLEEIRASHLLLTLKEESSPADTLRVWNKIMEIRNKILAGEDFEKMARAFSEDPSAKIQGGDLGYFSVFEMVYPFESAAYDTKVGEISMPVRTRFGYHLIKVIDRRPASGEVEVSHIMLRVIKDEEEKVKNKAFQIFDLLKAGSKWDELCKEFSEDNSSKNTGGKIRSFSRGAFATSAPIFSEVAFSMKNPGDISDPFLSPFGWHIVRLDKKIPVPSYKDVQATLSKKISRDDRLQVSKTNQLEKLKKDFGFRENPEGRSLLIGLADSTLQKAKWNFQGSSLTAARPIFSIGSKEYRIADFLKFAAHNQTPSSQAPSILIKQLYDKFIEWALGMAEEDKLEKENPEFKMLLNEYREGILLFSIMEKEVWNKASADSSGQRKFYEARKNQYKAGDRVSARMFGTDDLKLMIDFKNKIKNGDTLSVAELRKLKIATNFRSYEKGESKVIDKISWSLGMHELELEKMYYLVEVNNLIPPGLKSFDEARAVIISDYQDQLEKEWIDQLKKKFSVSVKSKVKKEVIRKLTTTEVKSKTPAP